MFAAATASGEAFVAAASWPALRRGGGNKRATKEQRAGELPTGDASPEAANRQPQSKQRSGKAQQ